MIKLVLLYLILLLTPLTASDLTITINVAGNSVGTLYLCLVDNEIDFNFIKQKYILVNQISKHTIHTISHPINNESIVTLNIKNLNLDIYSAMVFLDSNNNKILDYGLIWPTEPVGFSQNPSLRFKSPSFKETHFNSHTTKNLIINLN